MSKNSDDAPATAMHELNPEEIDAVAGAVMNMSSVVRLPGFTVTTWVDDKTGKVASVACVDGGNCFWSDSYYD